MMVNKTEGKPGWVSSRLFCCIVQTIIVETILTPFAVVW